MRYYEEDDTPVIGMAPEDQVRSRERKTARRVTSTTEVSEFFEREWATARMALPSSVIMVVPVQPWQLHGKTRFLAWIKNQFLPACDGDVELAKAIVGAFCQSIGRTSFGSKQAYQVLGSKLSTYRKLARQSGHRTDAEREASEEVRQREALKDERRAAARAERIAREEAEAARTRTTMTTDDMYWYQD